MLQQRRAVVLQEIGGIMAAHTQQVHWATLASMYDYLALPAAAAVEKSAAALLHICRTLQTRPASTGLLWGSRTQSLNDSCQVTSVSQLFAGATLLGCRLAFNLKPGSRRGKLNLLRSTDDHCT